MENDQNSGMAPQDSAPITPSPAPEVGVPTPPAAEPMSAPSPTSEMPQAAPAPAMDGSAGNAPSSTPVTPPVDGERRGMAAISYLGILCLIPLFFAKDSQFAQYHAKQGLIIAAVGVLLRLISDAVWGIPFGGLLVAIISIGILVVSIMGIIKALHGEKFDLPYISEWAAKIHF